jgi:hypothetical protein
VPFKRTASVPWDLGGEPILDTLLIGAFGLIADAPSALSWRRGAGMGVADLSGGFKLAAAELER